MAAPSPSNILIRCPGRLCMNPGSLAAPFPHGGTALGVVKAIIVRPNATYKQVIAEEFAEPVEVVATGEAWTLAAILRSYDADMLSKVFPNTVASSFGRVVQHPLFSAPNTNRAGRLLSSSSIVLLFSPDSPTVHPAVLFYRALPMLDQAAELSMSLSAPTEIGVVFAAIRSLVGKSVAVGPLSDLVL